MREEANRPEADSKIVYIVPRVNFLRERNAVWTHTIGVAVLIGLVFPLVANSTPTYRTLLESGDDRIAGAEIFQVTFDDFPDLISGNALAADAGFTQLDLPEAFSIAGLVAVTQAIPLPSSILLFVAGLGAFHSLRRKRITGRWAPR